MKQILFPLLALLALTSHAQDAKTVFISDKMVFYGVDFTKAKFAIPDANPEEIKNKYIPQWSTTVMGDNERFNREGTFQKLTVYGDPSVTDRRNAQVNVDAAMGKPAGPLSKEEIQEVINDYKGGLKSEGLGLVIIIESFSKKDDQGAADFVFFDIATRKVLLSKRLTARPGGSGLTNFWTHSIQLMFEDIAKTQYEIWKKENSAR